MRRYALLAAACLAAVSTFAADPVQYNMISLSAEAHRDVTNDQATATLYVEYTDSNAAALSDRVNRAVSEGMKLAKTYTSIHSSVGSNNTYPVYTNNNKMDGWRGHAEIRLESTDIPKLGELIGKLQTTMQLGGITFKVTQENRERIQTELIDQAIEAFRARAEVVRKSVGGAQYKLVNMNVKTQDGNVTPYFGVRRVAAPMSSVGTEPAMDAGQTTLTVEVSGTVQVQ